MVKKIFKWIGNVITALCVVVIIISTLSVVIAKRHQEQMPSIFGYVPMTVLSGSMSPALKAGDLIVIKYTAPKSIAIGDVITYRVDEDTTVTHRVINKADENGKTIFKTKGDANNVEDWRIVSSDQLVGSLKLRIPYGGYVVRFLKSIAGLIILVIVPTVLLVSSELKKILSEIRKVKSKESHPEDSIEA